MAPGERAYFNEAHRECQAKNRLIGHSKCICFCVAFDHQFKGLNRCLGLLENLLNIDIDVITFVNSKGCGGGWVVVETTVTIPVVL